MLLLNLNNRIHVGQFFSLTLDDDFFKMIGSDILRGNVNAEYVCDKIVDDSFHFVIHSVGNVFTLCDRCLDEVELRIDIKNDIVVRLGDEDIDEGDLIYVDRNNPVLSMDNLIYQFILVNT